jgi:hypothetical protein
MPLRVHWAFGILKVAPAGIPHEFLQTDAMVRRELWVLLLLRLQQLPWISTTSYHYYDLTIDYTSVREECSKERAIFNNALSRSLSAASTGLPPHVLQNKIKVKRFFESIRLPSSRTDQLTFSW